MTRHEGTPTRPIKNRYGRNVDLGATNDMYPLVSVCQTCNGLIRLADSTADWAHLDDWPGTKLTRQPRHGDGRTYLGGPCLCHGTPVAGTVALAKPRPYLAKTDPFGGGPAVRCVFLRDSYRSAHDVPLAGLTLAHPEEAPMGTD